MQTAKDLQMMVNYFNNCTYWRQQLLKWGRENNCSHFLKTYTETRWYSFLSMCKAASNFEEGFKACVNISRVNDIFLRRDIESVIEGGTFTQLKHIINILTPLTVAIGELESKAASVGDVWGSLINIHKALVNISQDSAPIKLYELRKLALRSLNKRAEEYDKPVYIIAMYLSPRYKLLSISKKYSCKKVHKLIAQHMMRTNPRMTQSDGMELKLGLQKYNDGLPPYSIKSKSAIEFWGKMPLSPLQSFAKQLLGLVPSSASVERLFSKLGRSKTKARNRMSPETLARLGKIKLDLLNGKQMNGEDESDEEICEIESIEEEMNVDDVQDYDLDEVDEDEIDWQSEDIENECFFIDDMFDLSVNEVLTPDCDEAGPESWVISDLFSDEDD